MNRGRRTTRLAGMAVMAMAALVATACGSGGSKPQSAAGAPVKGGTATVPFTSGTQPNWIFPFESLAYASVYNGNMQGMMYRPLYWFGGENVQPTVDYGLSTASPPTYSDGGKTVVINMKGWKWSDGETVDAKDVLFWLHMMEAEYQNWFAFVSGGIPQNITSMAATGPLQVTLHLNKAYSSLWYTYNELSQVTPMPLAWDVTSAGAAPGSGGCTADSAADHWAKCKAVYSFLTAQAKDTSGYATSPVWTVVNGPWKLKSFNTDGSDTLVPNPAYSGSPKPRLAAVRFVTYTSDTALYTALQSGTLDLGQIPTPDLPVKQVGQVLPSTNPLPNYTLQPAYEFKISYYQINFLNPALGAAFKQLYVRQALEYVDDQAGMAKTIGRGYWYATTGPTPTEPPNQWVPAVENGAGPYPFSISKAVSLLTSHGWAKVGGVMTCTDPARCGPGIAKGQQLKMTLDYSTGTTTTAQEAQVYKSDAAQAGIVVDAVGQSFNTIIGEALPSNKSWQAAMYGSWVYAPDYEPTGGELFATGAGSNGGSYSDPTMDNLINLTHTSGSLAVYHTYATFAAEQLPYIWMPDGYHVDAVAKNLHGVVFNPLSTLLPEYWYLTK